MRTRVHVVSHKRAATTSRKRVAKPRDVDIGIPTDNKTFSLSFSRASGLLPDSFGYFVKLCAMPQLLSPRSPAETGQFPRRTVSEKSSIPR
ncbi:hypothetical protein AVEN_106404-1 [Araneus ventricosus]|uniref:Uncharacterized protein n=1 Tax=Araneus ventricosus TaxID=182803 RepID=A0A4Y2AUE6_ARAVE|nr:hypothetical protein AVEN_106404-1 [Araneus ventricosus]